MEDLTKLPTQEWNKYKQEQKRVREINAENLKDMQQKADYDRLSYEIAHYQLETIRDFIERQELYEKFEEAKRLAESRRLPETIQDPSQVNLEN